MFKLIFTLLFLIVGILADGNECDFNETTCGIDYLYQFIFGRQPYDDECQLALGSIDCYVELTKKCDAPTKNRDLKSLENLRLLINYTCDPSEFNYIMPAPLQVDKCREIMSLYVPHESQLPVNDTFRQNCPIIVNTASCMTNELRTRLSPQQDIFKLNLLDQILSPLCDDESTINKLYRENVECLNRLFSEGLITKTLASISKFTAEFASYLRRKDLSDGQLGRAISCITIDVVSTRFPQLLEKECSPEAGQFVRDFMKTFYSSCPAKYFGNEYEELTNHMVDFMLVYNPEDEGNEIVENGLRR